MCGIAAIFAYKNNSLPVCKDELCKIRDAMIARGPDGKGLWMDENSGIGLAHRRLAIIDTSDAGLQPMYSEDSGICIVFNGEIYNYQDIRVKLLQKGYKFNSTSDTEVLLHLYVEKGPEMVHELRGMYAFVIWDKIRKGMFLARDPFGIKPLYYADNGNTIRIASQVKALLQSNYIDTELEAAGHVGFFLWGHIPEPYTLYKGIKSLTAGSSMWVDKNGCHEIKRFCNICDILSNPIIHEQRINVTEVHASIRELLLDTVKHHMVADVPVGIFLSSGLDSTTLTALASEFESNNLRTLTLAFEEYKKTEKDESLLAELTANNYGTLHKTNWISKTDFEKNFNHLLQSMDQPTIDGVNTYFVSKLAAESGLKAVLSGAGADELFGGYSNFKLIPKLISIIRVFPFYQKIGVPFRRISASVFKHFISPKYAGLFEYGGTYSGAYILSRSLYMPWELQNVLDDDVIHEGWISLQPLVKLEETITNIESAHIKISAFEMECYLRNQLLRDSDWAGMAHSLEIRVPFVDVELLKKLMPLIASSQPVGKHDMAKTPFNPLPKEVMNRPKTGFAIPVEKWLSQMSDASNNERGLKGWAKIVYKSIWDK